MESGNTSDSDGTPPAPLLLLSEQDIQHEIEEAEQVVEGAEIDFDGTSPAPFGFLGQEEIEATETDYDGTALVPFGFLGQQDIQQEIEAAEQVLEAAETDYGGILCSPFDIEAAQTLFELMGDKGQNKGAKMLSGDFSSLNLAEMKYANIPAVGFKIVEASVPWVEESEESKILSGKFASFNLSQVKLSPCIGFKILEDDPSVEVGKRSKVSAWLEDELVGKIWKGGSDTEYDDEEDDTSTESEYEPVADSQLFDFVFCDIPIERRKKKKIEDLMESAHGIELADEMVPCPENGEMVSPYYYYRSDFHEKNESSIKRIGGLWLTWLWRPLTSSTNEVRSAKDQGVCSGSSPAHGHGKKIYECSDKQLKRMIDDDEDVPKSKAAYDKLRAHLKQLDESEGFDIDFDTFPGYIFGLTPYVPVTVSQERFPKDYDIFEDVAKFALDTFNFYQKTNFKVVEVLKVNVSIRNYVEYLMTFTASDVKKGFWRNDEHSVEASFQAQVLVYLLDKKRPKELKLCRIKPDSIVVLDKKLPKEVEHISTKPHTLLSHRQCEEFDRT